MLTNEIKNKLVRDLKREPKFKDSIIYFDGEYLSCISQSNGTVGIDYSDVPNRYSYTKLLKATKAQLNNILHTQSQIREALKNLPYEQFIKKIKAIKLDEPTIDTTFHYKYGKKFFQFTATSICFDETGQHQMQVCITQDVIDAHGVDIETFFKDVADCYMTDGVDILDDSFPTYQ